MPLLDDESYTEKVCQIDVWIIETNMFIICEKSRKRKTKTKRKVVDGDACVEESTTHFHPSWRIGTANIVGIRKLQGACKVNNSLKSKSCKIQWQTTRD